VALATLPAQAARFLEAAVASGLNILVSGGTQAGKTTLLNCLTAAIPSRERVVTCEEVFELRNPELSLTFASAPVPEHVRKLSATA
jgi:pilus assembly protein CpaF